MTTAAELKARLAKYATPKPTNQVPTPTEQGTSAAVQEKQQDIRTVASGGSVELANALAAIGTLESSAGDGRPMLPVSEHIPETSGTSANVHTVVANLQSSTLVVVERPAGEDVPVHSAADNGTVPGNDGDELGTKLDQTNPVHANFLQRLADLEAALLARDPLMKTHLGEIHKHMIQYEEISNLLRPHEIAKIMAAQQQHTGVILRAEVVGRSKAAAGKKAAKVSINDI